MTFNGGIEYGGSTIQWSSDDALPIHRLQPEADFSEKTERHSAVQLIKQCRRSGQHLYLVLLHQLLENGIRDKRMDSLRILHHQTSVDRYEPADSNPVSQQIQSSVERTR